MDRGLVEAMQERVVRKFSPPSYQLNAIGLLQMMANSVQMDQRALLERMELQAHMLSVVDSLHRVQEPKDCSVATDRVAVAEAEAVPKAESFG
jgi:hypothetical protein